MGFPNVPGAVPFRARAIEHENPRLAGFGPAVDAFACLSNLLLDLLEDGFVQGRHLHEFPVPDAPHRNGEAGVAGRDLRSEEHTSELQSLTNLVCRLLLEKKKNNEMPVE